MKIRGLFTIGMVLLVAIVTATGQNAPKVEKPQTIPAAKPMPVKKVTQASKIGAEASDLAAIRKSSEEFTKAFNEGNAHAVAAQWTEDGEFK